MFAREKITRRHISVHANPKIYHLSSASFFFGSKLLKFEKILQQEKQLWKKKTYQELKKYLSENLEYVLQHPGDLKKHFRQDANFSFMEHFHSGAFTREELIRVFILAKKINDAFEEATQQIYRIPFFFDLNPAFDFLAFGYNKDDYEAFGKGDEFNNHDNRTVYAFVVNIARLLKNESIIVPCLLKIIFLHEWGHVCFELFNPPLCSDPAQVMLLMSGKGGIKNHPFINGLEFNFKKYDPLFSNHYAAVNELTANWFMSHFMSKDELQFLIYYQAQQILESYLFYKAKDPEVEISPHNIAQILVMAEFFNIEYGYDLKILAENMTKEDLLFKSDLMNYLKQLKLKTSPDGAAPGSSAFNDSSC